MKKLLIVLLSVLALSSNAQKNSEQKPLKNIYYFKTFDDFFSGKKTYLGKIAEEIDSYFDKYVLLDTVTGKKTKVKLYDSAFVGLAFDNNQKKVFEAKNKTYYSYIAGNKNILIYFRGRVDGEYNKAGELTSGTFDVANGVMIYVKNLDFKNVTAKFEKVIADNPKLLADFENETSSSKEAKRLYVNNFIEIHQRYIKLYSDQLPKK